MRRRVIIWRGRRKRIASHHSFELICTLTPSFDVDFESATALYQVKRSAAGLVRQGSSSGIAKLRASKRLADDNGKVFKYIIETGEKAKLPQKFLDDATRKGVEIIEVSFTP